MNTRSACFIGLLLSVGQALAQGQVPAWVTQGPTVQSAPASFEVPLERRGAKLYVRVLIGSKPARLVVDTGSPSMLDATLASELGLETVGSNRGTDAHGAIVETQVVQANMSLGGVDFQRVPMMTTDFSASDTMRFFIGDGVLGSELLAVGAWQIDLKDQVLRFNTQLAQLPHVADATQLKLYQFGYPYMPILDVQFAKQARSKALFDTGASPVFSLSAADFAGTEKAGGIGKSVSGYGSPGASLSGQAASAELSLVELKTLSIGSLELGSVAAQVRLLSPSLIGSGILDYFVVTLDSRSESAFFWQYADGPYVEPTFGFTLAFEDGVSVAAIWEDSPAEKAGLEVGTRLLSINGVSARVSEQGLERIAAAMEQEEVSLTWDGGSATLQKQALIRSR